MAEDFLPNSDYVHVNIGAEGLSANHSILQIVDVLQEYEKPRKLMALLNEIMGVNTTVKVIIFAETKRKVDDLTRAMRSDG
jgi:superfamily II DNA/RNA helicase